MAKALNIKNMKETLVNYCGGDEKEFGRIYQSFLDMALMGFIDDKTWDKFSKQVKGWYIDGDLLMDFNPLGDDIVVYDFDNGRDGSEWHPYSA